MKDLWNLKDLFEDERKLNESLEQTSKESEKFKQSFENQLSKLNEVNFSKALKEYERLLMSLDKIGTYAFLCFASDTNKGGFYAKIEQICKQAEANLLFFELEICELDKRLLEKFAEFCPEYAYYLTNVIKYKKHNLSQKEERIALLLSSTGASAFSRLFDESMSRLKISFEGKKISEEEALSKLYSANRKQRKEAAKSFSKALKKNLHLLNFILNMIKSEKALMTELRSYENAEQSRHLSNQISKASVDALIECAEKNFHLVSDFYKKKKQILGLKTLKDYDRYAPIGKEFELDYERAKSIVLKAFNEFSPEFGKIAQRAFNEGWIDVYPRENKRGGAFSCSAVSDTHPYVLLNYTNRRRDLFTLAHELGHSIHQMLSYKVSFLNQNTPLTTAETASVFAEMLVFDYLKKQLKNKDELMNLYAAKIEDIFATLFRQINFTTFERRIHAFKGELSAEKLAQIWLEESKKMFKDSVILSDHYKMWYAYIPHFIHSPFYCYAYAYAQLLVLALYGLYKNDKRGDFVNLYIELLSSGGSKSPKELISKFGFDIEDKDFWDIGMKEVEKLVSEFKKLKA